MGVSINIDNLGEILESFYNLTHIRIVLFDKDYNELMSYPSYDCGFCRLLKSNPKTALCCKNSDLTSFEKCKKRDSLVIYKCHAGLIEATAPLKYEGHIIGYAMFGQICPSPSRNTFLDNIDTLCNTYELNLQDVMSEARTVRTKSDNQIIAASKILEICACYIIMKDLISPKKDVMLEKLEKYIDQNIERTLTADELSAHLHISRSTLYRYFDFGSKNSISDYIRTKRLVKACELLKNTDIPVLQIVSKVGFCDYNYFSKVFKKHYRLSPGAYRKKYRNNF
ncbi:MAG: PocR ligand-binding domain-containing protein [Clostridia bacterium]|nr:PocR ligand-binding domain-containing protein [Clostridia bacterium]